MPAKCFENSSRVTCVDLLVTCLRCLHFVWVNTEKYNVLCLPMAQERETNPSWTQQHLSGNQRGKKKCEKYQENRLVRLNDPGNNSLTWREAAGSASNLQYQMILLLSQDLPQRNMFHSIQDISSIILNRDQRKAVSGAWSSISSLLETAVVDMHLCLHERSMKWSQPPDKFPSC